MIRKIRVLAILVLAIATLFTVVGCKKGETLKMGTNAEFPPFEFVENNKFAGIDVDLAEAIAKELGMKLEVENMAFDTLIDAVNSGKVDFVAAGMTANPEREKNADFTMKYYNATQTIIIQGSNNEVKSNADLEGKKIGVQTGTTGQDIAGEIKDAEVSKYNNGLEAVMDLKNGKIDAIIIDNFPAMSYVDKNPELKLVEGEFEEEQYAMAVKKGNTELLEKINKALQKLIEDGTYNEILDKYSK